MCAYKNGTYNNVVIIVSIIFVDVCICLFKNGQFKAE